MITAAQIVALVSAPGATQAAAQLLGVGSAANGAGASLKLLAVGAVAAAGIALVALGAASAKMAGDFEEDLKTLVTGAGEAESNLKMVHDGILKMAVDTGTSTKQLTDGLYMIESAGFHGAAGLKVLQDSAEGAKVGAADLGVVADGVTTIMKDFGTSSAVAVNTLIATVANGKTHMSDLANSLSTILPTASAVGVSLMDVSAAMATMTGEGVDAANASTYLRQLLIALVAPGDGAVATLNSIGLTAKQVSDMMKVSLPATLQLITDHLKKKFPEGSAEYVAALKEISGGSKQMQGILDLTGTHLQEFKNNVDNISGAVKKGGDKITGWNLVQENFNFKMAKAKEVLSEFMIHIGEKLLPVLGNMASFFTDTLVPRIQLFVAEFRQGTSWLSAAFETIRPALDQLGTAFGQLFTALKPFAPILGIIAGIFGVVFVAAIGLLVGVITGLANAFSGLIGIFSGVVQVLSGIIDIWVGIFTFNGDKIKRGWDELWHGLLAILYNIGKTIVEFIKGFASGILGYFHALPDQMFDIGKKILEKLGDGIKAAAGGFKDTVQNVVGGAFSGLGGAVHGATGWSFAEGTDSAPGGVSLVGERGPELVYLPRGAKVMPNSVLRQQSSQPVVIQPNDIYIDGQRITQALMPYIVNAIRLATGGKI
jgi:TP901 family phage tail tape measure protein